MCESGSLTPISITRVRLQFPLRIVITRYIQDLADVKIWIGAVWLFIS